MLLISRIAALTTQNSISSARSRNFVLSFILTLTDDDDDHGARMSRRVANFLILDDTSL